MATTRRELIAGVAGGAAAGSLAIRAAGAVAAPAANVDVRVLSDALQVERVGVIAYRQALSSSVLSASVRAQLQALAGQERQHVARLEQVLSRLGATLPTGPATAAAAQGLLTQHGVGLGLSGASTQHDWLRLLIDIESLTEGAYYNAIPQLDQPALLRIGLELMGSDSQHWTVLSGIQHRGDVSVSVPYPFVQGSP